MTDYRQREEFAAIVNELVAELEREFPDPVDVFKDDLAAKLGLYRHPDLPMDEWRRLRVQFIEAVTADEE